MRVNFSSKLYFLLQNNKIGIKLKEFHIQNSLKIIKLPNFFNINVFQRACHILLIMSNQIEKVANNDDMY